MAVNYKRIRLAVRKFSTPYVNNYSSKKHVSVQLEPGNVN